MTSCILLWHMVVIRSRLAVKKKKNINIGIVFLCLRSWRNYIYRVSPINVDTILVRIENGAKMLQPTLCATVTSTVTSTVTIWKRLLNRATACEMKTVLLAESCESRKSATFSSPFGAKPSLFQNAITLYNHSLCYFLCPIWKVWRLISELSLTCQSSFNGFVWTHGNAVLFSWMASCEH